MRSAGSNEERSRLIGSGPEANLWLGPTVKPLHLILVVAHGQDSQALIPEATRAGTFNGGFVELGYSPTLRDTIFARYDGLRNQTQGVPDNPRNLNDQDAGTIGFRHTFDIGSRAEYALHGEFTSTRTKMAAANGSDVRKNTLFFGIDFAF